MIIIHIYHLTRTLPCAFKRVIPRPLVVTLPDTNTPLCRQPCHSMPPCCYITWHEHSPVPSTVSFHAPLLLHYLTRTLPCAVNRVIPRPLVVTFPDTNTPLYRQPCHSTPPCCYITWHEHSPVPSTVSFHAPLLLHYLTRTLPCTVNRVIPRPLVVSLPDTNTPLCRRLYHCISPCCYMGLYLHQGNLEDRNNTRSFFSLFQLVLLF